MEEILASIRRIISDEVASGSRDPSPAALPMRALGDDGSPPGRSAPAAAVSAPSQAEVEAVDESSPPEDQRTTPDLPPFVSRASMNAARAESLRTDAPRPEASRPAYPSYAPLGRTPSADPFTARRGSATAAALAEEMTPPVRSARPEPLSTPAPRPSLARQAAAPAAMRAVATAPVAAVEVIDQDERLAAALLDLDLVEQAVQAELAIMSSDAMLEAATAASDETRAIMDGEPAQQDFVADSPEVALVAPPAETPRQEATIMEASRSYETPSVPENADMQAKPAPVSRSAASELVDERRPEHRAEPRFLPSARPADPAPAAEAAPQRLVSGSTTTAVSSAFGSLARTVASNSRTVDDLVTEAIRPMLKEWLDDNLPALVERLVRAEIERVSRQGQ